MGDLDDGPRGWARPLHERVLDTAGVGAGTTLLDLGCGAGVFARAAADRGARVRGVDADGSAVARAVAAVPEGEFHVGDVHELAEADATMDVAAAVQLVAHVTNPVQVLREAARVVRPGGAVAVTVWGGEDECDIRVFGEALAPWLPPRRPAGRSPAIHPPPVTEPDRLRRLVGLAGLVVATIDEVTCPFVYPDEDELLAPLFASGLGRHVINRADPAAVRTAVLNRLAAHRTPEGGYHLNNLFRVLVAHRP